MADVRIGDDVFVDFNSSHTYYNDTKTKNDLST